jgi:two-component system OmpR family sensor kinase/two-component system sensor histidine kinase BaeS
MTSNDQGQQENTEPTQEREWHRGMRYFPVALFFIALVLLFIGGSAALLYNVFSEYSGVQNIWVLVCCVPFGLIAGIIFVIYNLYSRYGRPLQQMFSAIDSVAEGDLSVRVQEDSSPQFGELIKRFNKMVGELERADQQRRNLTADIAHELRTPLHIIQGKLEGITDGVYEATPQHINDALEETRLLSRLVNDLQTLSMAETGQLPLNKTTFLVGDLIRDLSSSFSPQAMTLGIQLEEKIGDPDQKLTADYVRLNQVFSNLISNALRHTSEGGSISLETERIAGERTRVRIRIRDTGEGISPEDLPFIFDRFWRGGKSRTREGHASSGLGLAIAKQLIHAHGGTIEAQSELGKGTTFVIELPE